MHACEGDNLKSFFLKQKGKWLFKKTLKKVKVKKNEFKKIEIKKIEEEMKTRMKEKLDERKTQKCFFEIDSVLKNNGGGKRKIKKAKLFNIFFDRSNEKKRSLQKEENFVFVRMQGLFF